MTKGLTRDAIVEAAFVVLDKRGLLGLTVRSIAEQLGVQAPALYWHVRDKQEVLDEMGTRVWSQVAFASSPHAGDDWRTAFSLYARAARGGLLAHRDGARAFSGTYLTDPDVLRRQEATLGWLQTQGFSAETAAEGYMVLTSFVVGHCIEEQARSQAEDDRYSMAARDERIDAASHPRVAASGRGILEADADRVFESLLTIVLDGLAGRRSDDQS